MTPKFNIITAMLFLALSAAVSGNPVLEENQVGENKDHNTIEETLEMGAITAEQNADTAGLEIRDR